MSSINTIRPVIRRFPASRKVLEASNLPLAITVTPAASAYIDDDPSSPKSLVDVPKCEHCGAPHADASTFRRLSRNSLLCFLCGKSSNVSSLMVFPTTTTTSTHHGQPSLQLYKLPLRLNYHHQYNNHANSPASTSGMTSIYEVPAIQCPVLWYVVLDGTCSDPHYWKTMSDLLSDIWKQAPSYVHVALWILSSTGQHHGISIFDLESAVPHLQSWSSDAAASRQADLLQTCAYLTPCDSPHIATAIRSLLDYHPHSSSSFQPSGRRHQQHQHHHPFPLSWICEVILASLDQINASTAGQRATTNDGHMDGIKYAGGRILCLLGDPSTGGWHRTQHDVMPHLGGRGGAISKIPGERYSNDSESGDEKREQQDDIKSNNEHDEITSSLDEENDENEVYADLGRRLADAALAVDVLAMSFSSAGDDVEDGIDDTRLLPGFPRGCRVLVDRSGAPGPLFFDCDDDIDRLRAECLARAPWRTGTVYGAELRLRLSVGFQVASDDNEDGSGSEQGLLGPGTAAGTTHNLWKFGVADPYTTYAIDLVATNEKNMEYYYQHRTERWESSEDSNDEVDDGEVSWIPVLQTCFAYTTILSERDENTGAIVHKTVRRMRIASRPVPIAETPEALFASLDTEALAVVLFHKIALAAKQDGLIEAAEMAKQWLTAFLVCVYRSAEQYLPIQREYEQKGILNHDPKTKHYFYPGERLLDLEGDLSAEEVVLAQGHERLRPIPLMVFLLLQSDALRCRRGSYQPTKDLRTAALAQMSSMTPGTLTRCIAPRLQLWESGHEISDPILDVMDLRSEAVQSAILEYSSSTNKASDLIVLLDTPEQIIVMDARFVNSDFNGSGSGSFDSSSHASGGRNKPHPRSSHADLVVGKGLRAAIEDAADSYRTPPKIIYELDQAKTSGEQTFLRLMDFLIEDTFNVATGSKNFQHWKKTIAREVEAEIEQVEEE